MPINVAFGWPTFGESDSELFTITDTEARVQVTVFGRDGHGEFVFGRYRISPESHGGYQTIMTEAMQQVRRKMFAKSEGYEPEDWWYAGHDISTEANTVADRLEARWLTVAHQYMPPSNMCQNIDI